MILNREIIYIMDTLNKNGYEAFLVGGAVRNHLLGMEVKDYDITTNAKPSELVGMFKKTIMTGAEFGTVIVVLNEAQYEITTYRRDYEYLDHRRPSVVRFSDDLAEDLLRRDFTINAICMDKEGKIVDLIHGMDDIKNKTIRAIGQADERFREDALRMMRGVRLMTETHFNVERETIAAIRRNAHRISYISGERIQHELNKILVAEKPSIGIRKMMEWGLLEVIIPEMIPMVGFDQHSSYHDKDVFEHTLAVMDASPQKVNVRLAAMFHDVDKPNCLTFDEKGEGHFYGHHIQSAIISRDILKRLKYPNETIDKVYRLIRYHPLKDMNIGDKGVKRFINKVGVDNINDLFALNYADIMGKSTQKGIQRLKNMEEKTADILHRHDPLTLKELAIKGTDLMEAGVPKGPVIGKILEHLLAIVLDNPEMNDRDLLLKQGKQLAEQEDVYPRRVRDIER